MNRCNSKKTKAIDWRRGRGSGHLNMIIHLEGGYGFARKAMSEIEKTVADLYSNNDSADDTEETVAEAMTTTANSWRAER